MPKKNSHKNYGGKSKGYQKRVVGTDYVDNQGMVYDYKIVAKMSSMYNIFVGCLHNGFPVGAKFLVYDAWAFWPFFFVRKDLKIKDPVPLLNHERIHCRQQWELHLLISLPIFVFVLIKELMGERDWTWLLLFTPFVPTVFYGISMIRAFIELKLRHRKITFNTIREETCFERESNMHQNNWTYLGRRKFLGVLSYTCIKLFRKYNP